jgi:hypothetical protein
VLHEARCAKALSQPEPLTGKKAKKARVLAVPKAKALADRTRVLAVPKAKAVGDYKNRLAQAHSYVAIVEAKAAESGKEFSMVRNCVHSRAYDRMKDAAKKAGFAHEEALSLAREAGRKACENLDTPDLD